MRGYIKTSRGISALAGGGERKNDRSERRRLFRAGEDGFSAFPFGLVDARHAERFSRGNVALFQEWQVRFLGFSWEHPVELSFKEPFRLLI